MPFLILFLFGFALADNSQLYENPYYIRPSKPPPYESQDGKTALAVRKGVKNFSNPIPTEVNSYMELVQNSKIFVDTSLLIKELFLHHASVVLLLAPSKWGKTINLDMIKTFVEFQIKENGEEIIPEHWAKQYQFFHDGKIHLAGQDEEMLEHPLLVQRDRGVMMQYLQRYPTIYICFKDTIGKNYTDVQYKIAQAISRTFEHHKYMIKLFEKEGDKCIGDLQLFKQYLYPNQSNIDTELLLNSTIFLSTVLRRHFYNTKILVLLDDYDTPAHSFLKNDYFPNNDGEKVLQFLNRFTFKSFKGNRHLEQGFITGTVKLAHCAGNFDILHFIADEYEPLREFFGFKLKNLQMMFEKVQIDKDLSQRALNWYNTYDQSTKLNQPFYNPSSIAHFLKYKNIDNYWKCNQSINFIQRALHSSQILRDSMIALISKQTVDSFVPKTQRIYVLGETWASRTRMTNFGANLFFLYLLGEGYLMEIYEIPKLKTVKIPSNEVAYEIANWMIHYYQQQYHLSNASVNDAAFRLLHFIKTDNNSTVLLQLDFEALYKLSLLALRQENSNFSIDEYFFRGILHCVVLQAQCLTKFQLDVYYDRTKKANIVIIDEELRRGTIIEFTYKQSSQEACRRAESYKDVFKPYTDVDKIILIGVNFLPNRVMQMSTKLITP